MEDLNFAATKDGDIIVTGVNLTPYDANSLSDHAYRKEVPADANPQYILSASSLTLACGLATDQAQVIVIQAVPGTNAVA